MRTRSTLLLLPLLASCSLALSEGPPPGWRAAGAADEAALEACQPDRTWGFVDAAFSILALSSGYLLSHGKLDADEVRGEHILTGALVSAAFGIGATIGFRRADACEDFRDGVRGRSFGPGRLPGTAEGDVERAGDLSILGREELGAAADGTVLLALQRLRPQWLRGSGARNDPPRVILDDQRFELDILETVRPDEVESVRFLQPADATLRWGTGYTGGAIEVRRRR